MSQPVQGMWSGTTGRSKASLSWSHTINNGLYRVMLVAVQVQWVGSRYAINAPTYNGVAMAALGSVNFGTRTTMALYYLLNNSLPTSGTYTVTASSNNSAWDFTAGAADFAMVSQTVPFRPPATNAGSGAAASLPITSTVTDAIFSVCGLESNAGAITPNNAGAVTLFNLAIDDIRTLGSFVYCDVTSGSKTINYINASASWGTIGVSIQGLGGRTFQILNS